VNASLGGSGLQRRDLLIGLGNELRQDDGVGLAIAAAVEGWHQRQLTVLATRQLTPELAPLLAEARRVLFVDAALAPACPPPGWQLVRLAAEAEAMAAGGPPFSHHASPDALLQLAGQLYGRTPPAWQLLVRAHRCELGSRLTPATASLLPEALAAVRHWCGDA
jgi:hydrogenase maturation protease